MFAVLFTAMLYAKMSRAHSKDGKIHISARNSILFRQVIKKQTPTAKLLTVYVKFSHVHVQDHVRPLDQGQFGLTW